MADPFSDQDHGPSGASKRPAQTIEGTATEISEEAAGGDAAREAEAAAGADRPDIAGEAPHGVDAALPPAQASLPELKSFVTHLAAGVLGGLVGVVGLALAWGGLGGGGSSGPQPDIAALEARIAKLETAPPASGDGEALAQLKAQVEALETGVKETSPKLADLADRVGQLETSLKAISQSASDGGSVASAAAIAQQIAEAEQRLDAKLADALAANASSLQEMQSAIAELKAKIGALAELGTGDGAATGPRSPRSPSASPSSRRRCRSWPPRSARKIMEPSRRRRQSPSPIFAPRSAMDGLMPPSSTRSARWCPPSAISAFCPLMPKRASRPCPILRAHSLSPRRARRWRRRRPPAVRLSIR